MCWFFKKPLEGFLGRTKRIGPGGLDASESAEETAQLENAKPNELREIMQARAEHYAEVQRTDREAIETLKRQLAAANEARRETKQKADEAAASALRQSVNMISLRSDAARAAQDEKDRLIAVLRKAEKEYLYRIETLQEDNKNEVAQLNDAKDQEIQTLRQSEANGQRIIADLRKAEADNLQLISQLRESQAKDQKLIQGLKEQIANPPARALLRRTEPEPRLKNIPMPENPGGT